MKKIVPFNNVLNFNTDVREITAISLEHNINTQSDLISGTFYISGEYKITDGQLDRETFNFELPFDIALGSDYDRNTLVIDIDDFRYELIDRDKLKVNIDLFIDGEVIEPIDNDYQERCIEAEELPEPIHITIDNDITNQLVNDTDNELNSSETISEFSKIDDTSESLKEDAINQDNSLDISFESKTDIEKMTEPERIDLLEEMLSSNKEDNMNNTNNNQVVENNIDIENNNEITNNNVNIFGDFNEEEKYVTYRVYRVSEGDTIDKILEKYNVSKEELNNYNDITNINVGDKLIIPTNDK